MALPLAITVIFGFQHVPDAQGVLQQAHPPTMAAMLIVPPRNPQARGVRNGAAHSNVRRKWWLALAALSLHWRVWMLGSMVVVYLPAAGFQYSSNQLFWLAALPALSGATLRVFCAFGLPWSGGRYLTALFAASLLSPAVGLALEHGPSPRRLWRHH